MDVLLQFLDNLSGQKGPSAVLAPITEANVTQEAVPPQDIASGSQNGYMTARVSPSRSASPRPLEEMIGLTELSTFKPTETNMMVPKGQHTQALYRACTQRRVTPYFEYYEHSPCKFAARLTLGNTVLEEAGLHSTKKAAKEAVAEQGLAVLKEVSKAVPLVTPGTPTSTLKRLQDVEENWIGLLLEYCTAAGIAPAAFEEDPEGLYFTCTVSIQTRPYYPFEGGEGPYTTKKAAKTAAAREAVQWLRENHHMGATERPKKKTRLSSSTAAIPIAAGVASSSSTPTTSFGQQVNEMCPTLNLCAPEYRFTADSQSMYSGAAYFTQNSDIPSPIGQVEHVYGKKNAREAVARHVLEFLEAEKARRLAPPPPR